MESRRLIVIPFCGNQAISTMTPKTKTRLSEDGLGFIGLTVKMLLALLKVHG